MTSLANYLQSQITISEQDLALILSHFQEKTVRQDRFLLQRGQTATAYYFVQSGALRIYFDKEAKQVTGWIALEGEFFTDLSSYKNQSSSRFNIQALEDTILLIIQKSSMEQLLRQFPQWQQLVREVWENAFVRILDGIINFQTMSAEERYLALLAQPALLQKVPLKHLSSFLGITPTSLSRLRKNIK